MAISRSIQNHLGKGDFDAVENEWLSHLEEAPEDLDYFVGVARALSGNGEEKRARLLLEMLDETLRERHWETRLKLLRRAGELMLPPDKLHPAIVSTLGRLYGDRPTFKGLAEAAGIHRATHDIPKTWEKVERLESLLAFDVGTVVAMEGKGVGRVVEANLGLESFKIDFERHRGLMVGFKAAAKLLRPLQKGHVLRRKLEEPEALKAESPPQLLHNVLQSAGRPVTAGEIRDILAGIVSEAQWTSWWSAARRHPQVVASGAGARQTYQWAESSGHAQDAVWRSFAKAAPRKRLELLRREGGRDRALRERMAEELAGIAAAAAESDPGLAWEIWFGLERGGGVPEDLLALPWAPAQLLQSRELGRLYAGIDDRLLRERAYLMTRELRADWPAVYRDALTRETDPRALDVLYAGLGQGAPKEVERFLDQLLAQPHRQPAAFVWLAERAATDEQLRARNPLRMLQQILANLLRDEFAPFRVRLLALAESGGTLPRLLAHLSEDQAAQADEAVHRAAGLEPYQRDQLASALELRFHSLRRQLEQPLYATHQAIAAKRAELDHLMTVDIPANRKAIAEARALGDLRENFEYKAARQRHEYLNTRAAELNNQLARVRPIEAGERAPTDVRIGTRVRLRAGDRERVITLLGPWESNPEDNVISYESDLGKQLLGLQRGATVALGGESWSVEAIDPV